MVDVDEAAPGDIVDRLLWRDAQHMLERHVVARDGDCVRCGWRWPCSARRLAERADAVARGSWREAWTLRHDLNSMRALPGRRAGLDEIGSRYTGAGSYHRNDDHRRYQA
ncbi:hypothetical protein [Actinoplanes xinjiangensis]|jgi:hypothetical protein|uniref:Uncharacterized protein n=1 Tax=Actinoplanes xinjiangensis TaxID=512350 RepID=A0A316F699_9ACTN|nr:hypothetical protein [Actinoplanes xinjiangensis]PWK40846.1 hypothetical protein BC793_11876 [Actinoplanes xinjiangensis]GIF43359.1 hypothetical protein Axi01nite_76700 [Actinoplanes xinjiangensis]